MIIDFIPSTNDPTLTQVNLGQIFHGYIIQVAPRKYRYFQVINDKAFQRHEADNLDVIKTLVTKVP